MKKIYVVSHNGTLVGTFSNKKKVFDVVSEIAFEISDYFFNIGTDEPKLINATYINIVKAFKIKSKNKISLHSERTDGEVFAIWETFLNEVI